MHRPGFQPSRCRSSATDRPGLSASSSRILHAAAARRSRSSSRRTSMSRTPSRPKGSGIPVEEIVNTRRRASVQTTCRFYPLLHPFFCVANPDIRLGADPFPALLGALADGRSGVAGPLVRAPDGGIEDSARRFPTPGILIGKLFGDQRRPDYPTDRGTIAVDWVAGMFMLFRRRGVRSGRWIRRALIFCTTRTPRSARRLRSEGRSVAYVPGAEVYRRARRTSRRDLRVGSIIGEAWRFMRRSLGTRTSVEYATASNRCSALYFLVSSAGQPPDKAHARSRIFQEVAAIAQLIDLEAIETLAQELAALSERGGRLFVSASAAAPATASRGQRLPQVLRDRSVRPDRQRVGADRAHQ